MLLAVIFFSFKKSPFFWWQQKYNKGKNVYFLWLFFLPCNSGIYLFASLFLGETKPISTSTTAAPSPFLSREEKGEKDATFL